MPDVRDALCVCWVYLLVFVACVLWSPFWTWQQVGSGCAGGTLAARQLNTAASTAVAVGRSCHVG